ncbi:2722_t:CDS:2 [Funneliformis mosseae]|uniref:2722_t:CDS:1 n=1 Tax=Funneliformis mosseae TaxID=27381 RepID=A0A9N9DW99_FUNMO|nr:2722_t:CDS:2 [Funneliformis mosseae]
MRQLREENVNLLNEMRNFDRWNSFINILVIVVLLNPSTDDEQPRRVVPHPEDNDEQQNDLERLTRQIRADMEKRMK